jgi:glycine/serine hydroxymethyltransferase
MTKKPSRPLHIAPLQRVVAEPITDPAEQAAIDEKRRLWKAARAARRRRSAQPANGTAVSSVLSQVRQLPTDDRLGFLAQLAGHLSPDVQLELLEQTLLRLPSEALERLAEELRVRVGTASA